MKVRDSENIAKVYNWASELTAESMSSDTFYETKPFSMLMFRLEHTVKSLTVIQGLQGTGKTRLLNEISKAIPGMSHYLKWTRYWKQQIFEHEPGKQIYEEQIREKAENLLFESTGKKMEQFKTFKNDVINDGKKLRFDTNEYIVKSLKGETGLNQVKREALNELLGWIEVWLIDMPDYSKSNMSMMNSDIDELQAFWETAKGETGKKRHLVIGVQGELVMRNPHFFWGKADSIILKPLSTDELVKAYKLIMNDNELLTDAALKSLAQLARGVFRRFKKYLKLTIEENFDENIPLNSDNVDKAISEAQLFNDMELELCDIFKDLQKRKQAVSILGFLKNNLNANLKTIAQSLSLSEFVASKLVSTLNTYGYIRLERGKGKEQVASLKFVTQ